LAPRLSIGGIEIELTRKAIKHAYLRVDGAGEVRMSAPQRMSRRAIEDFARTRLGWIRRQQQKAQSRPQPVEHKYVSSEPFSIWGQTVYLQVVETRGKPAVALWGAALRLAVHPGTGTARRAALVECWYREQFEAAVPPLLARWEKAIGVRVTRVTLRKMKTRWGSCSPVPRTMRLNTELARLAPEYLEYVVVHELLHLLEASHNARFKALLDHFLPGWRITRKALNGCKPARSNLTC
jgi:predicted metal-dependent hydrolase